MFLSIFNFVFEVNLISVKEKFKNIESLSLSAHCLIILNMKGFTDE